MQQSKICNIWHPLRISNIQTSSKVWPMRRKFNQCKQNKWSEVRSLSRVQLLVTSWTVAYQASPSMGFSRQEYWSGLPLPSPMTNLDNILKSSDITLPTKFHLVKAMVFPIVMYGCDSWTVKKLSTKELLLWTVVLEKTLESPLHCKEIKTINPKGNQSWIFIGRTDPEAEAPILWPPDVKDSLEKTDAGKDWKQQEKGTTEVDGWMASLTQWTRIWVDSGSWWWIGRPGVLQFMGSQSVRLDWATELN